jgi:ParB family chromosome partitioning protein
MSITIVDIPLRQLEPNPDNPRKNVGDITDLAESIKAQGLKQELLVTPAGQDKNGAPRYRIVIGHRRYAAAKHAGYEHLPCKIEEMTPREEREIMLIENTQRADLTPIEEADGYQGLLDLGTDINELAKKTGRKPDFVRRRLKLARIPQLTRDLAPDFQQLTLQDLDALAEFQDDPDAQQALARAAGTNNWQYELRQARQERDAKAWRKAAREYIRRAGLKTRSITDLWSKTAGYDYPSLLREEDGSFEKQWKQWAKDGHSPDTIIAITRKGSIGLLEPATKNAAKEAEQEDQARKERKARERERMKLLRDFHATTLDLRSQWIRKTSATWRAESMRTALMLLVEGEILGDSDYSFANVGGDSNWQDKAIMAYNRMAKTPLPRTVKDIEHGVYHLNCEQNMNELRERIRKPGTRIPHLLLLLMARQEADINANAWANREYRNSLQKLNAYYQALNQLGYPVSDKEREALAGGLTDERLGTES